MPVQDKQDKHTNKQSQHLYEMTVRNRMEQGNDQLVLWIKRSYKILHKNKNRPHTITNLCWLRNFPH